MKYFSSLFKWINKKYNNENIVTLKYKLSVSFSEKTNFLVQFPTNDKNWLIKEYTEKEWSRELDLTDPNKVYLKVFLTSNNLKKNMQVTLEIVQLGSGDPELMINEYFQIDEHFNFSEWLILKWVPKEI